MTVLVTCKFEDDSMKSEGAILRTTFPPLEVFSTLKGSEVNDPIWPEIGFFRDFMTLFVICKFDEDPITNEVAIPRTTYSAL